MTGRLSTGCAPIDDLLGGGIERGTVTQVYGPPAAGKTNLALSTAVRAAAGGGLAVYIDTEGLSTERFRQVASAAAAAGVASDGDAVAPDDAPDGDAPAADATDATDEAFEALTSRFVVTEVHDFEEQEEAVRDAEAFAEDADVVVLDSATGFYRLERTGENDGGEALRRVARQVTHLLSLARKHDLAVVLTNQVFTDPDSDRTRPLGGHTLEHWTGTVIRLDRFRGGNRRATLEKHQSRAAGESATFRITDSGLAAAEEF